MVHQINNYKVISFLQRRMKAELNEKIADSNLPSHISAVLHKLVRRSFGSVLNAVEHVYNEPQLFMIGSLEVQYILTDSL